MFLTFQEHTKKSTAKIKYENKVKRITIKFKFTSEMQ